MLQTEFQVLTSITLYIVKYPIYSSAGLDKRLGGQSQPLSESDVLPANFSWAFLSNNTHPNN